MAPSAAHAGGSLRRRVALHFAHDQVPAVAERFPSVVREGCVVTGGARREAVVGEGGIVVAAARVQRRHGRECLGITGLEAGGDLEQTERRILLAVLPRREPIVQQLAPQLAAVRGDVLGALRCERGRPRERGVGAGYVPDGDVVAAEVVPSGGVRALVVLDDGFAQSLFRLGELRVALVGLFCRAAQRLHPFVYLGVSRYEVAGGPRWLPPGLGGERDARETASNGEHGDARDGTHRGLEMALEAAGVNRQVFPPYRALPKRPRDLVRGSAREDRAIELGPFDIPRRIGAPPHPPVFSYTRT